ncbi:MAG: 3-oxoacyl-[acyl-carrier-protein] reductase [Planctomycetes bacterium]|nr:3-oxoacyl-[acyl-carrier-protein] reductase [Planctomycetota bacterium]
MAEKRLAVVTGAARGIGRAIVFELLKQGRTVAGLDMMEDQLKDLERAVQEAGFEVVTRCVDITQTQKFTEVLESLAADYGGIGILVNNAGITRDNLVIRMTDEEFDKVLAVNLRAAFVGIRAAAKSMLRNKFGRIINISSVSGVMGNAGQANYSASKSGLIGLAKTTARELAKKNVTANCIAPGFIDTEMARKLAQPVIDAAVELIPMKRMGTVEEVAKAVAFLASDDAAYITGQVLCVDGGMAM